MKSPASSLLNFPGHRPRRMRRDDWSRRLIQENSVSANDLIYPVFLLEGQGKSETVCSMPGVNRVSLDLLFPVAQECVDLGIPVLALFPVILNSLVASLEVKNYRESGIVTFLVTVSGVTGLGIGAPFWGLLAGLIVHRTLEKGLK